MFRGHQAYGLRTVGVYRVPGNAAGVAALAAALDRGEPPPEGDARWADVHVASSLLKAYLRRLPDPLLTAEMYPAFIGKSPELLSIPLKAYSFPLLSSGRDTSQWCGVHSYGRSFPTGLPN